jgi:hypothetical protein
LEDREGAIFCFDGRPIPSVDFLASRSELARQRLDQRHLYNPFEEAQCVEVVGHAVVLDHATILRLVVGYDAVGIIAEPLRAMYWLAAPHVFGTTGLAHILRNPKSHTPLIQR